MPSRAEGGNVPEHRRALEAEAALVDSEARYRRLFEAALDGILIVDAETGRIVDVNPYLTALTGYSRDDFLGRTLWEIGPFKDTGASRDSFAKLRDEQYIRYDDLPLATNSGGTVDVEFISNVYVVGDRRVIQCNIRDIRPRKRAETVRRRLTKAIEQADEMIVITGVEGTIEYVNPAFERVTGYSRAEAQGHNPRFLKSDLHGPDFYGALWETVASGRTWRGRVVNRRKDGSLYSQDSTISPVLDEDANIAGYVAVNRDVTASLALEAQLLQAQKMEAVGTLAGGVAHDFNNVLSVILSYAEMIGCDLRPEDPLRADLEEIRRAGLRAADITKQLLAFSRKQVLEARVVDLNDSVAALEKLVTRLLGAGVELSCIPGASLWNVKIDPGQFDQVLMNLAVNARDAMPRGGTLTVASRNVVLDDEDAREHPDVTPGDYVEIAVGDTGTGMDAETQARIFEPFFTTKEMGKGTGLGLATVFGIVRQSGGHIWVDSAPGNGTTFKVFFPRFRGPTERACSVPPEAPIEGGSETILLVEDEDQVRLLARTVLLRQGYVVLDAPNAGEALLICEQHGAKIDLLLTDCVLPRMTGRHLADRLAALRPNMKVLFMSGYTDDTILEHGILEQGLAFLQKPLTPTSLTRKVREILDD
jgi:PAS domain S-box-containing protein